MSRPLFVAWLLCTFSLHAQESKQELRLTAAEMFVGGSAYYTRMSLDGTAIVLMRGVLVENDGAAAGYSYQPNEEVLREGLTALKVLEVNFPRRLKETDPDEPPRRAWLLIGHNAKSLSATINGQEVMLPEPAMAGRYWKQYEIPAKLLKPGKNAIALAGDGKLWIAREDERSEFRGTNKPREQQSFQLDAKAPGERNKMLGPKNDIPGEYYIRLFIEGYHDYGSFKTATFDAANLTGDVIPPPNVQVQRIRIRGGPGRFAGQIDVGVESVNEERNVWTGQAGDKNGDFVWTASPDDKEPLPRYFEARATLWPAGFNRSPQLNSLEIQTEFKADKGWGERLKVVARQNPAIRHWDDGTFRFENLGHPRLAQFRKEYALDEVVKDCTTDLQRMEKLAAWTSQQWTKGHLGKIYPKWDALEILKLHEDGTPIGGFCQQYNIVFLQACESFGMPGRCVSIGAGDHGVAIRSGHEVVEIWSNELNKWVYVDGQAAWYFVDEETRTPLSLLELRGRQLAELGDKKPTGEAAQRPVDVVVLAKSPYEWKGLQDFPAFTELRMIPHSQFLSGNNALPLNQGMRGWFWTGHRVWTDELYPASVLYSKRETNSQAWNSPINQTQLWLQQRTKVGELDVRLENNMPSFAKYAVRMNGQEQLVESNRLVWLLQSGKNRLEVQAVNVHGLRGAASWFEVDYK